MKFAHSLLVHETDTHGTFEEFSYSNSKSDILLLAPHGGQVEPNTDTQALLIQKYSTTPSVWGTRGITNGDYNVAYNRWHTTESTHPLTVFPLYQNLLNSHYTAALSFHVMSEEGVIIGGQAPEEVRESLQKQLQQVFPSKNIRLGVKGEPRAGMKDNNFVNSINADYAIHIEESKDIAMNHPTRFARAISEWLNTTNFDNFNTSD